MKPTKKTQQTKKPTRQPEAKRNTRASKPAEPGSKGRAKPTEVRGKGRPSEARGKARPQGKYQNKTKPAKNLDPVAANPNSGERINKYLARCGLCSRREADRWVEAGRVTVNNELSKEPGLLIQPRDIVCVDGKPVAVQESFTYILYNKPMGQLCTRRDDKGRALIYDTLDVAPNVQSVGRLDMDSEGLLLLTDDGALTRALTHPAAKLPREYRVRVGGQVSMETLEKLRRGGFDIGDGDKSDSWEVTVSSETKGHTWLTVVITRGRYREVRRTLETVGHAVRRLIRTRFGPIRLEEGMPRGSYRTLNRAEVRKLLDRTNMDL
ncbi:rRNA pseudouridine synthase [Mariprofundus sp. NF]|uniref:pseudouridine synthase n=1 Tax=Mariprofundus sp. NF TaxID=2608716 RepID=UPI0015A20565|nr:pseudouridine synthase [Mariprofundus sp. NF]NWF38559.1 rRNA pseudouridine synthase [Mariprofundus sp. NF]